MNNIAAIVLAAGKGTRFQSTSINKVALLLAGKPLVLYGIEVLKKVGIRDIFVVVGFAKESVVQALTGHNVTFVKQKEQLGTANAVGTAVAYVPSTTRNVLVLNGDDPFYKEETIRRVIKLHIESRASITFTTRYLVNPTGIGRIVRGRNGEVLAIVEEKDASSKQRKIREVNDACYVFRVDFLKKYLPKVTKSDVTAEYYVTDLIALAAENGEKVATSSVKTKWKGINTPEDLEEGEFLIAPTLLYDGKCKFCTDWACRWKEMTGDKVAYIPFQKVSRFPHIPHRDFTKTIHFVEKDGKVKKGAYAVLSALQFAPSKKWLITMYERVPIARAIAEWIYTFVAARRHTFVFPPLTFLLRKLLG